jgi:hypothetical protein
MSADHEHPSMSIEEFLEQSGYLGKPLDFTEVEKPDFISDPFNQIEDWVNKVLPEELQQTFLDFIQAVRESTPPLPSHSETSSSKHTPS